MTTVLLEVLPVLPGTESIPTLANDPVDANADSSNLTYSNEDEDDESDTSEFGDNPIDGPNTRDLITNSTLIGKSNVDHLVT